MSSHSEKAVYWVKLLSKFVSAQLIVQALGLASGVLIIRTLSKEDYAYLTIANSMQAMMNGLADSGVSIGLSQIGGKVWNDQYRFGQLINSALELRKWLALISIILITPIMIWILLKNHMSINSAVLITIAVLIELYFYLEASVLQTIPQFHSKITTIQNLDVLFATSRLLLLTIAYLTFLNSLIAAFISTAASAVRTLFLRRFGEQLIDFKVGKNLEDQKDILTIVKNFLPNSIFYTFQGQISFLLISVFGGSQNVAELGALSRFLVIFALVSPIMSSIVFPAFSRCQNLSLLRLLYCQTVLSNIAFSVILILISYFYSNQMLWILGEKYYGLRDEFLLVMLLGIIGHIGNVMWGLCATKGWIKNMWIEIPVKISVQVLLLLSINLSSTKEVIIFGILSSIPSIILVGIIAYQNLRLKLV